MTGISNITVVNTFNKQLSANQKEMYEAQKRATAQFQNDHYYNMDPNLSIKSIDVENTIAKNLIEIQNCELSQDLLHLQENSLKNILDISNDANNLLVQIYNDLGEISKSMLQMSSKSMLSRLEYELSQKFYGMNIWNGSRIDETPFMQNDLVNGVVGDNYYKGDNFNLQLYFNNSSIEFGDRANLEAIRDLINALQMIRDYDVETRNKETLQDIDSILNQATDGIVSLIQHVGYVEQQVISINDYLQESNIALNQLYTNDLNGINEEDRALNLIDASVIQRKMNYLIPLMTRYIQNMGVAEYL
jgi:hypothetical protein